MNELMNWANLGTMAGATAAVLIIVQYVKPLIPKLDTRVMALILSVIVLEVATAISGGSIQAYAIAVLNAVIVASAAIGSYEVTFRASDEAKKAEVK